MRRIFDQKAPAKRGERPHEVGRAGDLGEAVGEFGPLALGDAGDEGFLVAEVDVERAGANCCFAADVLHRGAMEAGARKAVFRSIEDVIAALAERFGGEFGHRAILVAVYRSVIAGCAPQQKRMTVLFSSGRADVKLTFLCGGSMGRWGGRQDGCRSCRTHN